LKIIHLKLFLCALLVIPAVAHASTILSENFEGVTIGLGLTSAGQFTATGGTNIDVVGPGAPPAGSFAALCAAPESGNCLDMDGSGGSSQGQIQSGPITLNAGTTYFLSFDLIGSGRGLTTSTTVNFGPFSQTFVLPSGDVTDGIVVNVPITVGSTTITTLEFTSNTAGNIGAVLDNVLVTDSAVTPEPSTLTTVLGPVLLMAGILLRRREKK
jgi:hypothetical protein